MCSILEIKRLHESHFYTRLAVIDQGALQCFGRIEELEEMFSFGKVVKMILQSETMHSTYCIFQVKEFFEKNVPKANLIKYYEVC